MTYNLSEFTFSNDFFFIDCNDGSTIVFNLINEQLEASDKEVNLNVINIVVVDNDGIQKNETNIIGFPTSKFTLLTDYKEYEGLPLTKDNIMYCTLEVVDD